MELKVGDRVLVSGRIISEKKKGSDQIKTKKVSFEQAIECIFLGWSTIREGNGGLDSEWGEYDLMGEFPYFHLKKSIKVAKLARVSYKGNRYYKPISATVDQIEPKINEFELNFKPKSEPPPNGDKVLVITKERGDNA